MSARAAASAAAVGLFVGAVLSAAQGGNDRTDTYYEGNAVPGRDVPPLSGCTVLGKVYWPLTPLQVLPAPGLATVGWDWCQHACQKSSNLPADDGSHVPCEHFAFYPNGTCFLQGPNTELRPDPFAADLPHGFRVVSGPADCANRSSWAKPLAGDEMAETSTEAPTTEAPTAEEPSGPTVVGEGEVCNGSLPPAYATICGPGLQCYREREMPGAPGKCMTDAAAAEAAASARTTQIPATPSIAELPVPSNMSMPTLPPLNYTLPEIPAVNVSVIDMPTMPPVIITPPALPTLAPMPLNGTTVVEPPPEGATIVGYYYIPHTMEQSTKLQAPDWKACHEFCQQNVFCEHFAYWPDGGCHLQGNNVTLVKADCSAYPVGDNASAFCPGASVITGPVNLNDQATWPRIPSGAVTDAPGMASKGGEKHAQKHVWAICIVLALLALVAGGMFAAYTNGIFDPLLGADDDTEEGADVESDKSLQQPLAPGSAGSR